MHPHELVVKPLVKLSVEVLSVTVCMQFPETDAELLGDCFELQMTTHLLLNIASIYIRMG